MNKKMIALMLSGLLTQAVSAQDVYDVARLSQTDLSGTARFIGMGGALSALGGDMTTVATNPAGIGIYRSSDVAASVSAVVSGNAGRQTDTRMSFDQMGVVFSTPFSNYSSLRYVNFGLNYRKSANLFDSFGVNSNWDSMFSQTYEMADMTYDEIDPKRMPALASIASSAGVINYVLPDEGEGYWNGTGATNTHFFSNQTGGNHELDLTVAANFNDQVFLGLTIGYHDVRLQRSTFYKEQSEDGYSYNLRTHYGTDGTGVDFKLGAIFRPISDSGFRFGVSVHSPVFYRLRDWNGASIEAFDELGHSVAGTKSVTIDPIGYQLSTPWHFNFSLGHTVGNFLAIGAEYELTNYTGIRLRDDSGYKSNFERYVDDSCRDLLKTNHTLRVGLEVKPIEEFSIRAGYNFSTAVFKESAYRSLPEFTDMNINSFTETQYENMLDMHRFTLGMGVRFAQFYMDLAWQYNLQKTHFYAFEDYYINTSANKDYVYLPATPLDKKRQQVTLTFGYRF